MNKSDTKIISELRRDARISLSDLSAVVGLSRATVRSRLNRLIEDGVILGFSVVLKDDVSDSPIRGQMLLGIEGRGADKVAHRFSGIPGVEAIHTTNGNWDIIVELGTLTLAEFDTILSDIRAKVKVI